MYLLGHLNSWALVLSLNFFVKFAHLSFGFLLVTISDDLQLLSKPS